MTKEEAKRRAQAAFDTMAHDPDVWLTHGCPSFGKEAAIVDIITFAIMDAIKTEEANAIWSAAANALVRMETSR